MNWLTKLDELIANAPDGDETTPTPAKMYAKAHDEVSFTNAAKLLSVRPSDLIIWLNENKWIFRRGNDWFPYTLKQTAKYLRCHVATIRQSDGSSRITYQTLVTSKGLSALAEILTNQEVAR